MKGGCLGSHLSAKCTTRQLSGETEEQGVDVAEERKDNQGVTLLGRVPSETTGGA